MPETVDVRSEPADGPVARGLVAAMEAEILDLYGPAEMPTTAHPEELTPPDGAFVVLYEAGSPVAGGGVKRLDDEVGEIKRMYVVPAARSRGHARRLLAALEDAARELGYRRARLDTGPSQPHSLALYESAGYVAIPDYNGNVVATYWGEKRL